MSRKPPICSHVITIHADDPWPPRVPVGADVRLDVGAAAHVTVIDAERLARAAIGARRVQVVGDQLNSADRDGIYAAVHNAWVADQPGGAA